MPLVYPLINGFRYSWAEIDFRLGIPGALDLGRGITEINYTPKLEPGEVRAAGTALVGRTRGQQSNTASMTMLKEEATRLLRALGQGYGERSFNLIISYGGLLDTVTDSLLGARIISPGQEHRNGPDALVVKFDLSVMRIKLAGLDIATR